MGLIPENKPVQRSFGDNIKMIIYSEPMVGKTYFAGQFPNALLISTDGNYRGIDLPVIPINYRYTETLDNGRKIIKWGWSKFAEVCKQLNDDTQYDTIIVDLFPDIHEMCRQKVLHDQGLEHEQDDNKFGKIYSLINQTYGPVIKDLMNIDKNIILLAHSKAVNDNEVELRSNIPKSVYGKILGYVGAHCNMTFAKDAYGRPIPYPDNPEQFVRVLEMNNPRTGSTNRWGLTQDIEATPEALYHALSEINK